MMAFARIVSPFSVTTPTARPFSISTLLTPHADADRRAFLLRRFRHGLRDRAHAADRMAPASAFAIRFAEAMMQQHIGRARRIGARVIADDRIEAEGGFDRVALEPMIEKIAGGRGEDVEKIAVALKPHAAQPIGEPPGFQEFAQRADKIAFDDIGRRLKHEVAQKIGEACQAMRHSHRADRHRGAKISRLPLSCGPARV